MNKAKVLVITGDGLNCEVETLKAFKVAGAEGSIMHINELLKMPTALSKYNILAIPGGFSFGDEINSGQVLALKIKHGLDQEFKDFIKKDNLVIGICNGFQTLIKLGAFTGNKEKTVTLGHNRQEHFIDKWTTLQTQSSNCVWTRDLNAEFNLPIRHGEGKIFFKGDVDSQKKHYETMLGLGQIALTYKQDENGSYAQIAGICDESGRIFGLMPHPEAAINELTNPYKENLNQADIGLNIFKNAINYIENQL